MKDALRDTHGRVHRSLRLSVTDRCNFRCPYCMPTGAIAFQPRKEILSYEEFETLVRIGARLGITDVRVTGGEPLVRRDLPRLIRKLADLHGIQDLALTTNGYYLDELAEPLREAGLQRVTVSLDTLRPDRFTALGGVDGLRRVLGGLAAARRAGLAPVKINTVLLRGVNDDEILDLARWAREEGLALRFIELMPIGGGPARGREHLVPGREVKARIEEHYGLTPRLNDPRAPARLFSYADGGGEVGFINPVTEPFCMQCDRLRITADGKIRNCLFDSGELDLKDLLRSGAPEEEIEAVWRRAVRNKGVGGCLELQEEAVVPAGRRMWQIGG
ncbi:MAG TPA: GTP 3',8-cyclase MoaA [Candidatus Polarisedimenticolia bacterium]|jgi:cyclic pyranopterin phosphate synthase|nr:GTP 3',8-cyclase MoaA [Candidatus Polarisedimenticolia bacterium]